MFNSSDSMSSMYFNLQEKTFQALKASEMDKQIAEVIQNGYETFLKSEHIILTKGERKRLFDQVFRMFLEDILSKSNDGPST